MRRSGTIRKLLTTLLVMAIALWAEAGLALVAGEQVMQCSMTEHDMQAMGDMPCCPGDPMQSAALAGERPPCCSVSQTPERPLALVVRSERVQVPSLDDVALTAEAIAVPAAPHFEVWRSADAPRFVKAVLELKTDLRI